MTVSPQTLLPSSPLCIPPPSPSTANLIPPLNRISPPLRAGRTSSRLRILCTSSLGGGPGPGPGENDSRAVLDAFFLGKAVAEALAERVESTIGEFLSTVGRLQAEQQRQVQEFQEEVFERASKAKEKAAREAMEEGPGPGLGPGPGPGPALVPTSEENYTVTLASSLTVRGDEATDGDGDPFSGVE